MTEPISRSQVEELRRLAKLACGYRWSDTRRGWAKSDDEFTTACSPAFVGALMEERERLIVERDAARANVQSRLDGMRKSVADASPAMREVLESALRAPMVEAFKALHPMHTSATLPDALNIGGPAFSEAGTSADARPTNEPCVCDRLPRPHYELDCGLRSSTAEHG